MYNDGYDIEIPTVDVLRAEALKDSATIGINWDKMDSEDARIEMEAGRHYVSRLPIIEKLYNVWRDEALNANPAAIEASMWVYKYLVEELYCTYQVQDVLDKYELVKSITGLDKQG